MKKSTLKIITLVSLSILTACGKASDPISSLPMLTPPKLPDIPEKDKIDPEIQKSNDKITTMLDKIPLSTDEEGNTKYQTLNQVTLNGNLKNFEFNYALQDVNLNIKFKTDKNGKIIALEIPEKYIYERVDDINEFKNNDITYKDAKYISKGKEVELSYSDFGIFETKNEYYGALPYSDTDRTHPQIAISGGYDARRINESDIKTEMTFTGKYIGTLYHNELREIECGISKSFTEGDAILTIKPSKEGLITNLDMGWANINKINDKINITFNELPNYFPKVNEIKNITNNSTIGSFIGENPYVNDANIFAYANLSTSYFKDENGNPIEAVGNIQITETSGFDENGNTLIKSAEIWRLNASFGATRTK